MSVGRSSQDIVLKGTVAVSSKVASDPTRLRGGDRAFYALGNAGQVILVNPAATRMFGYTADEAAGLGAPERVEYLPDVADGVQPEVRPARHRRAGRGGRDPRRDRPRRARGGGRDSRLLSVRLCAAGPGAARIVGGLAGVEERKRAE